MRTDPAVVRAALQRRGTEADLDALLELDSRHRRITSAVNAARAEHNEASRAIASLPPAQRAEAVAKGRKLAAGIQAMEQDKATAGQQLQAALSLVPNLVHPDAPAGKGEGSGILLRHVGRPRNFEFRPQDHLSLGEALGIIDVKRAAKVSGSRFAFLKGKGAVLELGLIRMAVARLETEGFIPVIPPVLVRQEAMYGTGFFPTDEAQVYRTAGDELFLAGTSEVPIAAMHSGETFSEDALPLRYAGISTCFRREAGTYGKDTRGIIRVHQFDKVEMFSFCHPQDSDEEHGRLLRLEESFFQALQIPYRVVDIAAGELAAANYRKFDIEAWLPGGGRWLEVTSCSNDWDYQARRLGIRMKGPGGNTFVHTLNGTATALGRTMVALLENHQQEDGSVTIPEALREYTGFGSITA